jgi:phage/plasmid-associated DNA primase
LEITKTPYIGDGKKRQEIIDEFLDYCNNLFNNPDVVNFILSAFAYRIQFPGKRTYVCIIIYGEEGDGKNRFVDLFNKIFGDKYFIQLDTAKKLFGTHSCMEQEKLFVCVNEAKGKDNYENSDLLKARITTNTLVVNPKGIQEFKIDNYCDYLMTTNNENAVNIHDKSRRYLYCETTSYYNGNAEFFNDFTNNIVENPTALRVIYEYLKTFDYKQYIPTGNFQSHIPKTEIQTNIIKNNRDKILWFLEDMFVFDYFENEYDTDEIVKMKNKDLFNKWNIWIEKNKIDIKYSNISFGTRLGLIIKKQLNVKQSECIIQDTHHNICINVSKLKQFFQE